MTREAILRQTPPPLRDGRLPHAGARRFLLGVLGAAVTALAIAAAPLSGSAASDDKPLTEQDRRDIARAEKYINGITTLRTDFTQVSATGTVTRGKIYLSRPGRMRVEFDPPTQLLLVATTVWLIVVEGKDDPQYLPLRATPAGILVREDIAFSGDLTVTAVKREGRWLSITVVQTKERDKGSITLIFQTDPMKLVGWTVIDAQELPTQVSFENTETGIPLERRLFQYVSPKEPETWGR